MKKLIAAGKIAAELKEKIPSWIENADSALELVKKMEEFIKSRGFSLSFPVNIGPDNIAAHFTPTELKDVNLKAARVLKVDFGVAKDFWPTDTAITLVFDEKLEKLAESSRNALNAAIEYIEREAENAELKKIGEIIEREIRQQGYNPIRNLTGHQIWRNNLHAGKSIYNYKKGSGKLGSGIFAIEPFATPGIGLVREGEPSDIFKVMEGTPKLRLPELRKAYKAIEGLFGHLPFAGRWVPPGLRRFLKPLVMKGALRNYPVLLELSGAPVAQFEETVVVIEGAVYVPTRRSI